MGHLFYNKPLVVVLFFSLTSIANSKLCADLYMEKNTSNHKFSTDQRPLLAAKPNDLPLLMATLQDALLLKQLNARIREAIDKYNKKPLNEHFKNSGDIEAIIDQRKNAILSVALKIPSSNSIKEKALLMNAKEGVEANP